MKLLNTLFFALTLLEPLVLLLCRSLSSFYFNRGLMPARRKILNPPSHNVTILLILNLLWWPLIWQPIWNARNEVIIRGKVINPLQISKHAMGLQMLDTLREGKLLIHPLKSTTIFLTRQMAALSSCVMQLFQKKGRKSTYMVWQCTLTIG